MKGTDVTPEQMKSAEQFLCARSGQTKSPSENVILPFCDLVRIVAWYGALRYMAGRDGINSLDNPGICDVAR